MPTNTYTKSDINKSLLKQEIETAIGSTVNVRWNADNQSLKVDYINSGDSATIDTEVNNHNPTLLTTNQTNFQTIKTRIESYGGASPTAQAVNDVQLFLQHDTDATSYLYTELITGGVWSATQLNALALRVWNAWKDKVG